MDISLITGIFEASLPQISPVTEGKPFGMKENTDGRALQEEEGDFESSPTTLSES